MWAGMLEIRGRRCGRLSPHSQFMSAGPQEVKQTLEAVRVSATSVHSAALSCAITSQRMAGCVVSSCEVKAKADGSMTTSVHSPTCARKGWGGRLRRQKL